MHYKAVLIYVGEVLQNNVKNKLIVETPLKRISKGVALSEVWAVDTAWLKRSFYIIGSLTWTTTATATNTSLQKWITLHQALSRLFCLVWLVKCWPVNFFEDEFQRIVSKFRKEKEDCSFVFPSSTKREIRHFHVLFVQRRLRNVQKSVMHGDSSCFANVNLLLFWRSRCLISLI